MRDLAEPKVPEAPVLTRPGKPDLKIYDRLAYGQPGGGGGVRMTDTSGMQDRIS